MARCITYFTMLVVLIIKNVKAHHIALEITHDSDGFADETVGQMS